MTRLYLLRHGATPWNLQRRLQGHRDIELDLSAVIFLRQQRIPPYWLNASWFTSPLLRCRQTASLLGAPNAIETDLLKEMHWGAFEGMTIPQVNAAIRQHNLKPDCGLDLKPPGGESPRMVRNRMQQWLQELPGDPGTLVAVTHKGVIRAAISLASGWDMMSPFPRPIHWQLPHQFELDNRRGLHLAQLNCRWQNTPS